MKRTTSESDVFKPVALHIKDPNDWPIFPLTNVDVSSPSGDLASLLSADDSSPLNVTGHVESLDRAERQHLIYSDAIPANVTLSNIQRFSYGQFESGEIAFWAPGKAGWFEIHPSRRYRQVYRDMEEAIRALYFVSDLFREMTRKRMRQTSPETIFEKYAEDAGHHCPSEKLARALFVKHKDSLIKLMSQGKEGICWKTTAIFKFLLSDPKDEAIEEELAKSQTGYISSDDDLPAHLARKGKSALRPMSSRPSEKGASRQQGPTDLAEADFDIKMHDAPSYAPQSQPKAEENISRPIKRRRGRPPRHPRPDEASQNVTTHVDPPSEDDPPLPLHSKRPVRSALQKKLPTRSVSLVETPLPSSDANQPGDIWACTFDGCAHRIFGASSDQSKSLIEEHYKHHAQDSQAQLDLAFAEERPYLPVGNLIKKIRDMAAQQQAVGVGVKQELPPWKKELMLPKAIERKV